MPALVYATIVPDGNLASALAAALGRLIDNPGLRQEMGARGRVRAELEFGLEMVIERTLALYAEATS